MTNSTGDGRDGHTKEHIQQVALSLFVDDGYESTSMREIAERLGVTKAAIYYHFASKEDIVKSLIMDSLAGIDELTAWAAGSPKPSRHDVLERWVIFIETQGVGLAGFLQRNHHLLKNLDIGGTTAIERFEALFAAVDATDADVETRLRTRLAFASIHTAAMSAARMDAGQEEVFQVARRVANEILDGGAPTPA